MFKRAISLLLAGIMTILTLAGCGTNELGYLELLNEVNGIKQYELNSSTQIEVSDTVAGESYSIELSLKGEANAEDLDSPYINMDVILKVNGIGNETPANFIISGKKVYASKNAVLEILKLAGEYGDVPENHAVADELFNVELKDTEYILLTDLSVLDYSGYKYKETYEDIYDGTLKYINSVFKGFDPKLTEKTDGGYSMELTPESAVALIEKLITYADENRELIFDETVEYVEDLYDVMAAQGLEGVAEAGKEAYIAELKESRQDFYDFLDEAAAFISSEELKKECETMFEKSRLNAEIYKDGSSYKENIRGELVVEGTEACNFHISTEITPADVEKTEITENFITAEEFEGLYDSVENKINPVKKIEASWYPEASGAEVSTYRADGKTESDYQSYEIINNSVYLPLEYICESFGEEIQWDNESEKAYAVRDNKKIDMTGALIDGTAMVKVRDLEKLGYKINFTVVDGLSAAAIEK